MSENEKDTLDYIKGQLQNGYVDVSGVHDEEYIDLIKKAINQYEKNINLEERIRDNIENLKTQRRAYIKSNRARVSNFILKEIEMLENILR